MNADWRLQLAGFLITFSLRIALAWALCAVMAALLRRPDQRFLLWLSYSIGSAIYWVSAIIGIVGHSVQGSPLALASFDRIRIVLSSGWGKSLSVAASLLVSLYLVVVIILFTRMFLRLAKLRQLVQFGQAPSVAFAEAMKKLCQEMGIKRCELLVLPVITSPATVYWWNPRILLPEICHQPRYLSEFMHIMRHELVHIRRKDYLFSTIENIICTTLFFHPLIWSAKRRMQVERELASDLAVVEARPDYRVEYAASLTHLVRMNREERRAVGVSFSAPASSLGKRVRSILAASTERSAAGQLREIGVAVVMVAAFLLCVPWFSLELKMAQEPAVYGKSVVAVESASVLSDPGYYSSGRSQFADPRIRLCLIAPMYCKKTRMSVLSVPGEAQAGMSGDSK